MNYSYTVQRCYDSENEVIGYSYKYQTGRDYSKEEEIEFSK